MSHNKGDMTPEEFLCSGLDAGALAGDCSLLHMVDDYVEIPEEDLTFSDKVGRVWNQMSVAMDAATAAIAQLAAGMFSRL